MAQGGQRLLPYFNIDRDIPEIFTSLKEAKILIEQWRQHYNTIRPHSALGFRPPAPETLIPPSGSGGSAPLRHQNRLAEKPTMH